MVGGVLVEFIRMVYAQLGAGLVNSMPIHMDCIVCVCGGVAA